MTPRFLTFNRVLRYQGRQFASDEVINVHNGTKEEGEPQGSRISNLAMIDVSNGMTAARLGYNWIGRMRSTDKASNERFVDTQTADAVTGLSIISIA